MPKKLPFIVFEDNTKDKCMDFIRSIDCIDRNEIVLLNPESCLSDYNDDTVNESSRIAIFFDSKASMAAGGFLATKACTKWYAIHLRRFTEKDLSKQYSDIKLNGGTMIPNKDETTDEYANRVVRTILDIDWVKKSRIE